MVMNNITMRLAMSKNELTTTLSVAVDTASETRVKPSELYTKRGALNPRYVERIRAVIDNFIERSSRIFAIRLDLHLPEDFDVSDTAVISRFFASLQAKLDSEENRKRRNGTRVHSHEIGYVWCREIGGKSGRPHYHVYLFLNGHAFNRLGCFDLNEPSMFSRIVQAWASALKGVDKDIINLVHIPENPVQQLGKSDRAYSLKLGQLYYRASYLAKYDTKQINPRRRSFGCSHR